MAPLCEIQSNFSLISIVPKQIILKQTSEMCKNKYDTSVL